MYSCILLSFERMKTMAVTYNKLRHILVDKNMMKKDLQESAGLAMEFIVKKDESIKN